MSSILFIFSGNMSEAMSTPFIVSGDVAPVALFSPEPPSSVLAAVGLAEVASLEASLPASEPMTLQRIPTYGDGIVTINVDAKLPMLSWNQFEALSALAHDETGSAKWEEYDVQKFCNALLEVMSDVSTEKSRAIFFQERIKDHRVEFRLQYDTVEDKYFFALRMLDYVNGANATPKVHRECYILLFKKLPDK